MRRKTTKSNYRPPNRSEKILAVVGLLVVGSLVISALMPSFLVTTSSPPTSTLDVPVTVIRIGSPTPVPSSTALTPTVDPRTPVTATPGNAPAPAATP